MAAGDCVFCKVRDGAIPSTFLYEDDRAFVIRDINPKAPTHLLVIPKEHVPTVASLTGRRLSLLGHLTGVANRVAQEQGVADTGYRLVINNGPDSGMEVSHLHIHLLAGTAWGDCIRAGLLSPDESEGAGVRRAARRAPFLCASG